MSGERRTAVGSVVSLWRYPVKSMMGEECNALTVTQQGVLGDRAYALVDAQDGKVASAKNPRKWVHLFDFRAAYLQPPNPGDPLRILDHEELPQLLVPRVRRHTGRVEDPRQALFGYPSIGETPYRTMLGNHLEDIAGTIGHDILPKALVYPRMEQLPASLPSRIQQSQAGWP